MNLGKKFENTFKKSIPEYCWYYRIPDPPQSFHQTDQLRFSWKNPCDIFLFNTKQRIFYPIELKSTKSKSISFEDINIDKQSSKMIHKHQIIKLLEYSAYSHITAGFVFNFRDEKNGVERTYYQRVEDFVSMVNSLNKKSFNEIDIIKSTHVTLNGYRKRKNANYIWDIDTMFNDIDNLGNILVK